LEYKDAIPFTKYTGGIGRHAVGKKYKAPGDKVGWPQKATKSFLDLLTNVGSNAEVTHSTNLTIFSLFLRVSQAKSLELDKLVITHVNANQAPKMRRRTYRAHGRINGN
jgi:large subunit ribosomal protein L17e